MIRPTAFTAFATLVIATSAAFATPPPPPAPKAWNRIAWQCPGRERSSLEIEQLVHPSGYQNRVVELRISGEKIVPASVVGLKELMERGNYLRLVGGYCDRDGEEIAIEEKASGQKSHQAGWRTLRVPYLSRP